MSDQTSIEQVDPEIARLIEAEQQRQAEKIRLIPSENYVSRAVLEATGTVLTNKYSEGYPGRRYYEGSSSSTRSRSWRWSGPSGSSRWSTPMSSPTRAHRPTCHLSRLLSAG